MDALSGVRRGPDRFVEANVQADERIAELEELRALKEETPEWKQLAHRIRGLIDHYCAHADEDQHAALTNLADLMWHSGQYAAAVSRELHHWAAAADEADDRARALQDELEALRDSDIGAVQAHNEELFTENGRLRVQVRRLESELAQARGERDTARATGGVA